MGGKRNETEIAHWFLAIAHNNVEAAKALRTQEIPVNTSHPELEMTGLMLAARMGHETLLDWLLAEGAAPSIQLGNSRQTAFHLALEHGHMNCVRYLLESEANPNLRDALGRTPLHYTVHCDGSTLTPDIRRNTISQLAQHGAKPDITDLEGATPLHYSVIYGRSECTEALLGIGANPNAQTYECKLTPSHIALIESHQDMLTSLIAGGANPDIAASQGWTVRSRLPKSWNIALPANTKPEAKSERIFGTSATGLRKAQKVANSSTH